MQPIGKTSDLIWQDAQHRALFRLLEEVGGEDSAVRVLHQLRFYAESHFALEEEYMERLNYPEREAHVAAHDRFREELGSMLQDAHRNDPISRQLVSTFLTEWLRRHVLGIDRQLEEFILQSSAK